VVELSFKNGRKDFGLNSNKLPLQVGDLVLISTLMVGYRDGKLNRGISPISN